MTDFDQYIKDHREQLDLDEPAPNTWDAISAALGPEEKDDPVPVIVWWKRRSTAVAATVLLLLSASILIWNANREPELTLADNSALPDGNTSVSEEWERRQQAQREAGVDNIADSSSISSALSANAVENTGGEYTYQWSSDFAISDSTNSGTYTVTVTDANGSSSTPYTGLGELETGSNSTSDSATVKLDPTQFKLYDQSASSFDAVANAAPTDHIYNWDFNDSGSTEGIQQGSLYFNVNPKDSSLVAGTPFSSDGEILGQANWQADPNLLIADQQNDSSETTTLATDSTLALVGLLDTNFQSLSVTGLDLANNNMVQFDATTDLLGTGTVSYSFTPAASNQSLGFSSWAGNISSGQGYFYDVGDGSTGDRYADMAENAWLDAKEEPLSTFSIDVDRASYSNVRRYINDGEMPPPNAVRIEEMINYFAYDYEAPKGSDPFEVYTDLALCPWNSDHQLLHIGIQGKAVAPIQSPTNNLVFLIDVSGSMQSADRLALLKRGFELLVDELRPEDRVSIVVYAGSAGLVLPPTPGNQKKKIMDALERLEAGGSTAGGEGIELAYATAQKHFKANGNNRIILATDGDFNIGISDDDELVKLIEKKRESGVFLSVLGLGRGNLQDEKMEKLADNGNGNYAYIDNLLEAKKVLVTEMGGTLLTIAKDVKLQLEFNPAQVKSYRLIGYENRLLAHEDFANDSVDAGDLGAGHTVTALYEVVPVNTSGAGAGGENLLVLNLRYKQPQGSVSKLIRKPISAIGSGQPSKNFWWSAAVAEYGMLLRNSEHSGSASYQHVLQVALKGASDDPHGYRAEFLELIRKTMLLDK